jgi:hypothetical protein
VPRKRDNPLSTCSDFIAVITISSLCTFYCLSHPKIIPELPSYCIAMNESGNNVKKSKASFDHPMHFVLYIDYLVTLISVYRWQCLISNFICEITSPPPIVFGITPTTAFSTPLILNFNVLPHLVFRTVALSVPVETFFTQSIKKLLLAHAGCYAPFYSQRWPTLTFFIGIA